VPFRLVGWIDDTPDAIREQDLRSWVDGGTLEFLGKLDDVRPALAAASVYVLPSHREGTPRTVLEAMAMGRPIVTTDSPGCRETVRHGRNGFLVPVGDAPALASALERFILSPWLIEEMGGESRRIAVEKYDVHRVNAIILREMGLSEMCVGKESG
jgi:glycosyltransferase involved in cell wall biosynthesis